MSGESHDMKNERVWDPLVRFFHWSLVAAFATAWWGRGEAWIHEGAGKLVLALIIFRVVWGLIGPGSARFENFMHGPAGTFKYVVSILGGRPKHYIGHNPAGAAMIGLLLVTLAVTTVSGILMSTTALWGNSAVEWVHGTAAYAMLFLIVGHVLGVIAAAFQHRENLVWSMITGWKQVPNSTEPYLGDLRLKLKRLLLALAFVALTVGAWQGSTTLLNASAWRMHKTIAAELAKAECGDVAVDPPRFEIYPALAVHYDIKSVDAIQPQRFSLSAQQAIEKRPTLNFQPIADWCADIKKLREIKAKASAEETTNALPDNVQTAVSEAAGKPSSFQAATQFSPQPNPPSPKGASPAAAATPEPASLPVAILEKPPLQIPSTQEPSNAAAAPALEFSPPEARAPAESLNAGAPEATQSNVDVVPKPMSPATEFAARLNLAQAISLKLPKNLLAKLPEALPQETSKRKDVPLPRINQTEALVDLLSPQTTISDVTVRTSKISKKEKKISRQKKSKITVNRTSRNRKRTIIGTGYQGKSPGQNEREDGHDYGGGDSGNGNSGSGSGISGHGGGGSDD